MRLVIVHYHLRPGGIRRVIEMATPHVVARCGKRLERVVLATGEAAPASWLADFSRSLAPVPVEAVVSPEFRYLSEQRAGPETVARRIRHALQHLLAAEDCAVWIHNPAVGRNLLLARELATACAARGIPLVAHHHDWWFDHRWQRWPGIRRAGCPTLAAAAKAVFSPSGHAVHVAINQADAAILARHCGTRSMWLPNLTDRAPCPGPARVRAARRWLRETHGVGAAPVWLVPSRTLRRKNLAEALLLTRWLRPGAWLLITGGASSAGERPYQQALERAARQHQWPMRVGILAGNEGKQPNVADLLAASEVVLFPSIQEGFGLPYLEAATAARPLIARRLPNVMPDLARFGFRFPQSYDDILIDPELFDWRAESKRQAAAFRSWRAMLPGPVRKLAASPALLSAPQPFPVAFSRLTLAAQLEVLEKPAAASWAACLPWNPALARWRDLAASASLRVTPWPRQAGRCLGGQTYARHLHQALREAARRPTAPLDASRLQDDFIRDRLTDAHLHPLLWNQDP